MTNSNVDYLYDEAKAVREKAYAPYSSFKVGAALITSDGKIFTGCNIENASYGLTNCAERTAIFNAVSKGYTSFEKILIIGDTQSKNVITPCGACRQVMSEFMKQDSIIYLSNMDKKIEQYTMKELLPLSFNKGDL